MDNQQQEPKPFVIQFKNSKLCAMDWSDKLWVSVDSTGSVGAYRMPMFATKFDSENDSKYLIAKSHLDHLGIPFTLQPATGF